MELSVNLSRVTNDTSTEDGDPADEEDFEHQYAGTLSFALYQVVVPTLFGAISVVGIAGNSLVIYVILSRHQMRTVINLMLLNLAIADLSFVLIVPPFTAYHFAASSWPFGDLLCKLMHYSVNLTAYVTVYTLVMIAVIRYMTVVRSVQTMRIRTRRNIVLAIVAIWAVMLVVNLPILTSYGVKVHAEGYTECDHGGPEIGKRIFATFFVFAYILPLAIIAVFSLCILRHITHQKTAMLQDRVTRSSSRKRQASRLLVLVVVVFALLWLPIHIHLLVAYFGSIPMDVAYQVFSVVIYCLAYFNSCVNPIIYNSTSREFRVAFHEIVCCTKDATYRLTSVTNGSKLGITSRPNSTDRIVLTEFKAATGQAEDV